MSSEIRRIVTVLVLTAGAIAFLVPGQGATAQAQPPTTPAPPPPVVTPEPAGDTVSPPPLLPIRPAPPAVIQPSRPGAPRVTPTPPPPPPRQTTPSQTGRSTPQPNFNLFAMRTRGTPSLRLASVPNMLGDLGGFSLMGKVDTQGGEVFFALPLAGGALRTKISENNKALPMDRVYFQYNHFHNAAYTDLDLATPGNEFPGHLDRYTLGLEKTFRDKLWSVDVRMPVSTTQSVPSPFIDVSSGAAGNLSVIVKRLLESNERGAVATGIGINVPTGSDAEIYSSVDYLVKNEAVHLSPFLGVLYQPGERLFLQSFLEVDFPLNGNAMMVDYGNGPTQAGILTEQTLLQVDVSAGYWLYRNPRAALSGLASIVEFHYTGTLNDGDVIDVGDQFGGLENRFDLAHLTAGLHAALGEKTTLRVAGVFPLNDAPDRVFDAEVQVSLNRYF